MSEETNEPKPIITFQDFLKLDLRVAKVVEATDHPNADKLIVLKIDVGDEQRQLVAGLKGHYAPEELVGKTLIVAANLEPRKMRGFESQGMLLAASYERDGEQKVVILTTDTDAPPGSPVS